MLDTNLWIYFLISKDLTELDKLLFHKRVVLLFSEESINEFIEVARRKKFQKYFSEEKLTELFALFERFGEAVRVTHEEELCRDKKDNFLINLALSGKAHYLVSGDTDLIILQKVERTEILTWREFILAIT